MEILTSAEMGRTDRRAIAKGPYDGYELMRNAGASVVDEILARFADAHGFDILCGPGNNGGDGYVVARLLRERGLDVRVFASAPPRRGSDAALAARDCPVRTRPLGTFDATRERLVVDALFGADLSKEIGELEARAMQSTRGAGCPVVAIDLPSGVSGDSGAILGAAFSAALTVTFFRPKPGHFLYPGRERCGEVVVADIGIAPDLLENAGTRLWENTPPVWRNDFPEPASLAHKYLRGHVAVFSGGAGATGAARLSARAAARAGAGAVTVLSPSNALLVNAAHLTSIMLQRADTLADVEAFVADRRPAAIVLGPGFGVGETARLFALSLLGKNSGHLKGLVLDADAITSFADEPRSLFDRVVDGDAPDLVLTPHAAEFERLFPDIAADRSLSKVERARAAALQASAVVLLKGADTVVAAPDGRAVINANGTPYLATAGSGDVLAGIIAGLIAQSMPAFEAASAAAWLHAAAGELFGPGLIAEDLPELLPEVLSGLLGARQPYR